MSPCSKKGKGAMPIEHGPIIADPSHAPQILDRRGRICVRLTGLPPTPVQRATFLQQWSVNATTAYETLVEKI